VGALRSFWFMAAAAYLAASVARAEDAAILHARIAPADPEVRAAVGVLQMEIDCPQETGGSVSEASARALRGRRVDITLSVPNAEFRPYVQSILYDGVIAAYRQCPLPQPATAEDPLGQGGVGGARIFVLGTDGSSTEAVLASEYRASAGAWKLVDDLQRARVAAQAGQAARDDAQDLAQERRADRQERARAARQAREERKAAQASAASEAAEAAKRKAKAAELTAFAWKFIAILAAGGTAILVLLNWEALLRFWYELTPHPAQRLVNDAVRSGRRIDVDALRAALKTKSGSAAERAAREGQLRQAAEELKLHEAWLKAESASHLAEAERAARGFAERSREYDVSEAEAQLLATILRHETTAARTEALRAGRTPHDT
jgi:hypothetical protein